MASFGISSCLNRQSRIVLILPMQFFIAMSIYVQSSFVNFTSLLWNSDEYRHICSNDNPSAVSWNFLDRCMILLSFCLPCSYITHPSIICYLVSGVPHLWQLILSGCMSFLITNVSLDPSQPILILNMYLISFTLCLFNLMYSYALTLYSLSPNSQNNFSVGNSLSIYVLVRAPLTISQLMFVFTILYHCEYQLLQWSLIISKSVTFICSNSLRQYLVVFVWSEIAFFVILLCKVPSSNIVLPIMFSVFLLFSCDIFLSLTPSPWLRQLRIQVTLGLLLVPVYLKYCIFPVSHSLRSRVYT